MKYRNENGNVKRSFLSSIKPRHFIFGVSILFIITLGCIYGIRYILFNMNVGDYLKQAGDSNTVDLAKERLRYALNYIEANNLTHGYTSIVYNTPDEDVGFWYNNIKKSYDELDLVYSDTSLLERTNVLMKLRETLLDHGSNGVHVTKPDGIEVYPYNMPLAFLMFASILAFLIGLILCRDDIDG